MLDAIPNADGSPNVAREMNAWQIFWSRMHTRFIRFSRHFPRLVWYGDEVDVLVTFTADRLPQGLTSNDDVMRELYSGPIFEIEKQLSRLGVGFDKGMGFGGRDWEWDWSLSGPISVKFRRRTKAPTKRLGSKAAKQATGEE